MAGLPIAWFTSLPNLDLDISIPCDVAWNETLFVPRPVVHYQVLRVSTFLARTKDQQVPIPVVRRRLLPNSRWAATQEQSIPSKVLDSPDVLVSAPVKAKVLASVRSW